MELTAEKREKLGKAVGALRRGGYIPAELYGHGVENLHLTVERGAFKKVFQEAGENTLIDLVCGNERRKAVVHDITRDYLSGEVSHVDFYQVRMDEKLRVRVPIEFTGEPPAVKEFGGQLAKAMVDIEVEALPADLPHRLTARLDGLTELDQSLYVRDIAVPKEVRLLVDAGTVVATVVPPLKEEVALPVAPVDVGAVKVESEEKKTERQKEKEQDAAASAT